MLKYNLSEEQTGSKRYEYVETFLSLKDSWVYVGVLYTF